MIYAFEYTITGIGDHPLSGYHISRLTSDNDEDAIRRIIGLRNEIIQEFSGFPIEYTIHFIYKEIPSDVVNKLIKIGFTGESLVDYFGFNMMSVSEVLEELHNKENSTS